MQSLEAIKRKMGSTESLRSIVKTMKILAAVSIRQHEKMLRSLEEFNKTLEMGLQVVLKSYEKKEKKQIKAADNLRTAAVVFGSDMGMCGQFNETISAFAAENMKQYKDNITVVMAVGEKVMARLDDHGFKPKEFLSFPATLTAGIEPILQELIFRIEKWRENLEVDKVMLYYNKPAGEMLSYSPYVHDLIPVSEGYLDSLREKKWVSVTMPVFKMDRDDLFDSLIRNHLYVSLYRSFVASLTSENAARMASMEAAEKHINDRLDELKRIYNEERQDQITSELLDIIAGFETLTQE
jgi:F-type H+-transporting ATPase subunit gamma